MNDTLINMNACFDVRALLGIRSVELDKSLNEKATALEQQFEGTHMSAFVWQMKTGLWGGYNEKKPILPGSMMKLPLAMGFIRASQIYPNILSQTITTDQSAVEHAKLQGRAKPSPMIVGSVVTVDELIKRTLSLSDNSAAVELEHANFKGSVFQVINDLGIGGGESHPEFPTVNPRNFGRIFIYLATSTYLSPMNSKKVLSLLADSTYNDGLRSGVPRSIAVAHKFGEAVDQKAGIQHLTDCGIVYYTDEPYIACLHAESKDGAHLDEAIAALSKSVFDTISSGKRGRH